MNETYSRMAELMMELTQKAAIAAHGSVEKTRLAAIKKAGAQEIYNGAMERSVDVGTKKSRHEAYKKRKRAGRVVAAQKARLGHKDEQLGRVLGRMSARREAGPDLPQHDPKDV